MNLKIAVAYGYWSQNIGNAFFNLGAIHQIRTAFPDATINLVADAPGHWTLHRKAKGNPAGAFDPIARLDADILFILGPQLSEHVAGFWTDSLTRLRQRRGTKVALWGTGFMTYEPKETEAAGAFLSSGLVDFAGTRDSRAFELVRDHLETHSGIDSAFFLRDVYRPEPLDGDFIVMNYDRYPEPDLIATSGTGHVSIGGSHFDLAYPRVPTKISEKGHAASYLSTLTDRRTMPESIAGLEVCRTEHRSNPPLWWKVYRQPGGFTADEPLSFLQLYSSSALTFTDRVHTCVASLVYGTPVHFYGGTPRAALLERVGATSDDHGFLGVDLEQLELDKKKQLDALSELTSACLGLSAAGQR